MDSGCHKLSENIWFVWSKRSYSEDKVGCHACPRRMEARTECEDRARILNRIHNMRFSLLGRLEGLGAGAGAALGRRSYAAQQEQLWSRQRQAHALCVKQGRDLLRRGQFYMK